MTLCQRSSHWSVKIILHTTTLLVKTYLQRKEKKYHIASGHANWVVYNNKYKINSTIFEGYSYYEVTDIDDNKIDEEKNNKSNEQ